MSMRKELMTVLDSALRQLNKADEMEAESEAIQRVLDGKRAELGEVEQRLARIKEEAAKADAEHGDWRQKAAKEQAAGNARIDQLQAKLQTLEGQVAERRAEHENIIAGIAALTQRLKV